jgi:Lon protease-like protein
VGVVVFPGCLQPLNIYEPWAERLVHFVVNKVPKQRLFALLYAPNATDILAGTPSSSLSLHS